MVISANDVIKAIPEDIWQKIEAVASIGDRSNWSLGDYVVWIVEKTKAPLMSVYSAVAARTKKSKTTVMLCYYTSKFFDKATREEYEPVGWSIFNFARRCSNPEEILRYAMDNQATFEEIVKNFHPDNETLEVLEYENCDGFPSWVTPAIKKRMVGLTGAEVELVKKLIMELDKYIGDNRGQICSSAG